MRLHPLTALIAAALAFAAELHGAIVTTWTLDSGSAPTSGLNTANPVFGDGSNNSADNLSISGTLSGSTTIANIGDSIQMTGTLVLTGISNGNTDGEVGFGLFNTNGSANATGWLGYMGTSSDAAQPGPLYERNAGNTSIYTVTSGATAISSALAAGSPGLTNGTYSFSLSLTRQASNAIGLSWNLTRTSSAGYALAGSFTDTTGSTFTFNRVGFYSGNTLNADQFSLNNVNVTLVPEPAAFALFGPGLAMLLGRRRRLLRA